MSRFTWHHYVIILKKQLLETSKAKILKNQDKQTSVMESKWKQRVNTVGNIITRVSVAVQKSGAKFLIFPGSFIGIVIDDMVIFTLTGTSCWHYALIASQH